ncbi:MAG TPA: cell wall-binding repeat-containing protein, partial [Euzebya sp.]|nr:cell wall-binding repeat-containing protein [Euzebya sp.]
MTAHGTLWSHRRRGQWAAHLLLVGVLLAGVVVATARSEAAGHDDRWSGDDRSSRTGADPPTMAPTWSGAADGVRRLAGPERAATAAAVALDGWAQASVVVVVDGWDPLAGLVGAHLAARIDAPVLISGTTLPAVTADAISGLQASDLIVVGAAAVAEDQVEGSIRRLAAADPDALAVAALQAEPGAADLPVLLVTDLAFADALAAANLAPARLLVSAADRLSPGARQAIQTLDPAEVVLLGGDAALGTAVADAITDLGPAVRRVAGPDRYATAVTAAAEAGSGPVVVASGQTAADAVAFVPWVARTGAALLLSTHDELPSAVLAWLQGSGRGSVVVAGGTAAVGNFVDRQAAAALDGGPSAGFLGGSRLLSDAEQQAMTGVTWREGCPVGLHDLAVVELAHWDFTGNVVDDGRLVVHRDHAADLLGVAQALFDARFPLYQVTPIEAFGGDDDASMAANNTSAFNCRYVGGTTTWSQHAYGSAVDLNPVQNPYVRGDVVDPPAGRDFLDRTDVRPGMIVRPGPVTDAFAAIGWGWGADFATSDDYQHFSANGR